MTERLDCIFHSSNILKDRSLCHDIPFFPFLEPFKKIVQDHDVEHDSSPPFPDLSRHLFRNSLFLPHGPVFLEFNDIRLWILKNLPFIISRSEEHTSELQSQPNLVW